MSEDEEVVRNLLGVIYQITQRGDDRAEIGDQFLRLFDTWLARDGVGRVDLLFDQLDLDRVPASLGVLALVVTRAHRDDFARREAFVAKLRGRLEGIDDGRTVEQVDRILEGLIS